MKPQSPKVLLLKAKISYEKTHVPQNLRIKYKQIMINKNRFIYTIIKAYRTLYKKHFDLIFLQFIYCKIK